MKGDQIGPLPSRRNYSQKVCIRVKDCKSGLRAYFLKCHDERKDLILVRQLSVMEVVMASVSIRTPITTCLIDDGRALLKFFIRPRDISN